jgi:hypothetical protein
MVHLLIRSTSLDSTFLGLRSIGLYWRGAITEDFAASAPSVKRKVIDFTCPDRTITFFSHVEYQPCEEARKS